ncbi:hypothetical protein VNO78_20940 [Psophocarpus tetragonolobus]|uniref:Uncharacterized protein n=1 Tax=Psophocarpus tetragonolobus TaxID=3891 RepID=A0AAN9XHM3_PSOTE
MAFRNITIRRAQETTHREIWKAVISQFISTLIFVFAASALLISAVSVSLNISGGHVNPAVTFGAFLGGVGKAVVLEMVMTYGLVYATTVDPRSKRSGISIIAPIVIGFFVGANVLVGGPFDGASMNPALSFGPAFLAWNWKNHWIYWLGPLVGGGLARFFYELIFISHSR